MNYTKNKTFNYLNSRKAVESNTPTFDLSINYGSLLTSPSVDLSPALLHTQ